MRAVFPFLFMPVIFEVATSLFNRFRISNALDVISLARVPRRLKSEYEGRCDRDVMLRRRLYNETLVPALEKLQWCNEQVWRCRRTYLRPVL